MIKNRLVTVHHHHRRRRRSHLKRNKVRKVTNHALLNNRNCSSLSRQYKKVFNYSNSNHKTYSCKHSSRITYRVSNFNLHRRRALISQAQFLIMMAIRVRPTPSTSEPLNTTKKSQNRTVAMNVNQSKYEICRKIMIRGRACRLQG